MEIYFWFFWTGEFQNLGAVDLHIAFWTEATIEELITSNEIRSIIANPKTEPELKNGLILLSKKPSNCFSLFYFLFFFNL